MRMIDLRCAVKKCGRLLGWLDSADVPAPSDPEWEGYRSMPVCPVHGGAHGNVGSYRARQAAAGKNPDKTPVRRWLPLSMLRPAAEKARRTGKPATAAI